MIETGFSLPAARSGRNLPLQSSPVAADFETFLKMLTTQAQFQDPLKPIDSTEYAAQLAQFSMVEQQVQTNQNLQFLNTALVQDRATTLTNWIGVEVMSQGPIDHVGDPKTFHFNALSPTAEAALVLKSGRGDVVRQVAVDPTSRSATWDGLDSSGFRVPDGRIYASLEIVDEDKGSSDQPVSHYVKVREAQFDEGQISLTLDNGEQVSSDSITTLRSR